MRSNPAPSKPDNLREEIDLLWKQVTEARYPRAVRADVRQQIRRAEESANADAREHLSFWIDLLDEALHFLLALETYTSERFRRLRRKAGARMFPPLLARTCALTVAVRRLVLTGLEDAARPVGRSLIETIDLAIVCLHDEEFAEIIGPGREDYDPNALWKQHIGYGRLNRRLEVALLEAGLDEITREDFFHRRSRAKEQFAESVHSSLRTALLTMMVPSLARPGLLSPSILGHVSFHAPSLLSYLIIEIHHFGAVVLRLLISDHPPRLFGRRSRVTPAMESMWAAFFTLQELVENCRDSLPPPYDFPHVP